jgi:hypothetical protein
MQKHLGKYHFSHRIDVEPIPSHPVSWDELHQRFRKITFDINKKYLRTQYFPKWNHRDKFWICGCRQGGGATGIEKHYHLLLYTPKNHRIEIFNDLIWGWMKGASVNPMTGKRRCTMTYQKDKFHFANEPLEPKFLIRVEPVRNSKGSMIYDTRKMHPQMEKIKDFICIGVGE